MRRIVMMFLVFALAFGFVGCSDPVAAQPVEIVDENVKASIKVSILMDAGEKKMFEAAIKEFNKIYKNVTVELTQISSYESSLIGEIRAGAKLDVLHVSDNYVSYFAAENVLENLEPYIASEGFRQEQGFDRGLYYDSMMKLGQLNFDGDQYMMPRDYSKIVTYWNEDMFDEYNIQKRPTMDWTWDDFLDICEELKNSNMPSNFVPLEASMEYSILNHAILASNGVNRYLNDDFSVRSDEQFKTNLVKGLEMSKNVITSGYALKPVDYKKGDFFAKRAPMVFDVRPAFVNYANTSQNIDFKVAPFPRIGAPETAKIPTGTSGFGIYKGSRNKNVAWAFINFIMSYEGQQSISEAGGVVPVLKELAESEEAGWRNLKNGAGEEIDHNAFIAYPERDVVPDYFGAIPGLSIPMYRNSWGEFLNDYYNLKKDFTPAYDALVKSVASIKRYYPEYFA